MRLSDIEFEWVADVDPDRDANGRPIELMPQARYKRASSTPLNPHGSGPFCRFKVQGLPRSPGVYALLVGGRVTYVGKGQNLEERWGPRGYATISPRNCFVGGQSTNCKVNNRILQAAQRGVSISLWVHPTANPGPVEAFVIRELDPPWNGNVPWG